MLVEHGVIPPAAATELRARTGLRNRIAHGYASIDPGRLQEESKAGLTAIRAFLVSVADAAGL